MTETSEQAQTIIILGISKDGRKFRPSDWAERMSGMLSTFGDDHRIHYSPKLKPVSFGGNKGIAIALELRETHPGVFNQIIDFATRNELVIVDTLGNETSV